VISKQRTNRHGHVSGGTAFSRGAPYNILRNPIYMGRVRHKEELHAGLHETVIDNATWQAVQTQFADHGGRKITADRRSAKRALDGVLFDSKGRLMRTTYASKSMGREGAKRTKRCWYYTTAVSGSDDKPAIERLPADEVEPIVQNGLTERLADRAWLADGIKEQRRDATEVTNILGKIDGRRAEMDEGDDDALAQNRP